MYATTEEYKSKVYQTNHLLKVYLDGVEIAGKYILGYESSHVLFSNDEFVLGSVSSQAVDLKLFKSVVPDIVKNVYIESGIAGEIIPIGYFNVDDKEEDKDTITYKLLDNMIKFEFNYDGSPLVIEKGEVTLLEVLQDICSKAGVELGSTSFLNDDKTISVYDSTVSARTYIGYIAEQAGGFACIGRDGKLYIKALGKDTQELSSKYLKDFTWGEQFIISRIQYEDGTRVFEKGDKTNNSVYINQENMFIIDQEQIDNIYNNLNGFEAYGFTGETNIDPALDLGDILVIDGKRIIYQGSCTYGGRLRANISSKIQSKAKEETTTKSPSTDVAIRRVESQIEQQEGKITELIQETAGQSEKITTVEKSLSGVTTRVSSVEDDIEAVEENIKTVDDKVGKLDENVKSEVANLQSQIDGAIQFWNGAEIPTLNNEPALSWGDDETARNNHRADIYTVIKDIDGEMKQGKSYRFDKVGDTWTWVELTDNELSAVQALAASKAKVFIVQPTVPYNVGDLWLNNEELYECITAKDGNGKYSVSDWAKATKYTDDTVALLAQSTANTAIDNQTITATTEEGKTFHLIDSADNNGKSVEIFGESTQKTREGTNLFDASQIANTNIVINDNGKTIVMPISTSGNGYIDTMSNLAELCPTLKVGDEAILSFNRSYGSLNPYIYLVTPSKLWYKDTSLVITEDMLNSRVCLYGNRYQDGETEQISLLDFQINLGTEVKEWEQFGQMPSVEFPSRIRSVRGKNEFDISKIENTNQITNNGDGTLSLANTTTANGYSNTGKKLSELCPNLQVGDVVVLKLETTAAASMSKVYIGETWISGALKEITQTMLDTNVVLYGGYNTVDIIKNIQIEKNIVSTFCVPFNNIHYKSMAKNCFDTSKIQAVGDYLEKYNNGFKLTRTANGRISPSYVINLEPNQSYTLSADLIENTTTTSGLLLIWKTEDGTNRYTPNLAVKGNKLTATIKWSQRIVGVAFYIQDTQEVGTYVIVDNIQLEAGTETTEFEEYKGNITAIPLLHDMRSLPNGTRDRIYRDNSTGKWYDEQKIKPYTINENTSFISYSENTANGYACANIARADAKTTTDIAVMCDILKGVTMAETWAKKEEAIALASNGKYIQVSLSLSKLETKDLNGFKNFFSNNNASVIYELAEPIVTEITDDTIIAALESIRTFKGITNIESDTNSIITYYRNVAFVDEYETKQNAEKQYKTTVEKFAEQEITNEAFKIQVSEVKTTMEDNYATKEEMSTKFTETAKDFEFAINTAITELKENGVSKVVTTTVKIDDNGLTTGRSDSDFTNTMNNTGNYQYHAGELIAKYDKDGADIPRLKSDIAIIAGLKSVREEVDGIVHHKTYVLE